MTGSLITQTGITTQASREWLIPKVFLSLSILYHSIIKSSRVDAYWKHEYNFCETRKSEMAPVPQVEVIQVEDKVPFVPHPMALIEYAGNT